MLQVHYDLNKESYSYSLYLLIRVSERTCLRCAILGCDSIWPDKVVNSNFSQVFENSIIVIDGDRIVASQHISLLHYFTTLHLMKKSSKIALLWLMEIGSLPVNIFHYFITLPLSILWIIAWKRLLATTTVGSRFLRSLICIPMFKNSFIFTILSFPGSSRISIKEHTQRVSEYQNKRAWQPFLFWGGIITVGL